MNTEYIRDYKSKELKQFVIAYFLIAVASVGFYALPNTQMVGILAASFEMISIDIVTGAICVLVFILNELWSSKSKAKIVYILYDQYTSMNEVIDDIRTMTANTGPVKVTFYCPLVGTIEDDEVLSSSVGGRFLHGYQWAIEDAIEIDRRSNDVDMAEYFNNDDGVKAKLVSAKWGVEDYRGRLFGKIECSLKEELTDAETEILTDWICGQNSDGWGEGFEQHPIDTEDGDLYVSFWNSNDDYDIMTHDDLDAYIDNQGMRMGGM